MGVVVPTGVHRVPLQPLRITDPKVLGRHRVLGLLGGGGMGMVYLAEGPVGQVAIKLIRSEFTDDPEFRTRFQREVQACFRVNSAYTARLVDFELDADRPWLATEFVDAPDLGARVDADGPLSAGDQFVLATGVAEALASIHAAGLVHRDLKPSNVLWAAGGPKVIDFGIAAAAEARPLTATGQFIGTPGWFAPEQIGGGEVTAATDVFAWGILICFAATGEPPYGTGTPEEVLSRVLVTEPRLDESRITPVLYPLVRRALNRRPEQRPSAQDLCAALADHTGNADTPPTRLLDQPGTATRPLPSEEPVPTGAEPGPVGEAAAAEGPGVPVAPTRVARPGRLGRPGRRGVVYAAVITFVLAAVAGTLAVLLNSGSGDDEPQTGDATDEAADFTADGPWRIAIRDEIDGQDNGCTVTVTNLDTGDQKSITEIYGTESFQVQQTGRFSWEVNDPGCLVVGRSGSGSATLPFVQQAGTGDTEAFAAPAKVTVEVLDFNGSTECNLVLHGAADGREVDFGTVQTDSGPLLLDPNGRSEVYLSNLECGVRVSAGPAG
jgi:hypothetical protein